MTSLFLLLGVGAVPLASLQLSGCGGGGGRTIVIDEPRATYRGVGLGSSAREVEGALGRGASDGGFAPVGRLPSEVDVPLALPVPPGSGRERPKLLRYGDAAFLLARGRVFAMMLTEPRLRTKRGVAIGAEIEDVRRKYGDTKCYQAPAGESLSGGVATYPVCRIDIGPSRFLSFGGDPIHSFTFFSRERVRGGP